jgi:xanthine dehydrogenase accessory factor
VASLASRREPFATATVVRTEGSTLAKTGFKILIGPSGDIVGGTLGGGCPEGPIVALALSAMHDGVPRVVRVHLVDAEQAIKEMVREPSETEIYVETDCGGTLEVYVEPMMPSERVVIVGQGGRDDVEEALVRFAKALEFEVVVVDPNPQLESRPDEVIASGHLEPGQPTLGERDYVVVLTRGERDVAVLSAAARGRARYVGLLASRHRLKKNLEELRTAGVSEEFLTHLHSPIGIDIGAQTPGEIALSILSEIVSVKRAKAAPRTEPPAPTSSSSGHEPARTA